MLGVDKRDHLITYYWPQVWVRRFWMSIVFHCLDIVCINMYIIFKCLSNSHNRPLAHNFHKSFLTYLFQFIIGRSGVFWYRKTHLELERSVSPIIRRKRSRMSLSYPQLSSNRLKGRKKDHMMVMVKNNFQRECVYCRYKRDLDKLNGLEELKKVREPYCVCSLCNFYLCKENFWIYHSRKAN